MKLAEPRRKHGIRCYTDPHAIRCESNPSEADTQPTQESLSIERIQ